VAGSLDSPQSSLWSLRCRKDGGGRQPSRGTVGSGVGGHVVKSSKVVCQTPEGDAVDGVFVWMEIRSIGCWRRLGLMKHSG
jgi:hypothetical protein